MTDFSGLWSESVLTGILPHVTNTATGGTLFNAGLGGTGNIGFPFRLRIEVDPWLHQHDS